MSSKVERVGLQVMYINFVCYPNICAHSIDPNNQQRIVLFCNKTRAILPLGYHHGSNIYLICIVKYLFIHVQRMTNVYFFNSRFLSNLNFPSV